MVKEGDVLAQRRTTVHRRAQCRARAVGADQGVKADVVRAVVTVIDETRVARIEIHGMQATMEMHGGTGLFGQFQQRGVQIAAMDRPDHLAVVAAIALQLRFAVAWMHHAPAHHHRARHHLVFHTGLAQCIAPALGQRQVDRTTALVVGNAGSPRRSYRVMRQPCRDSRMASRDPARPAPIMLNEREACAINELSSSREGPAYRPAQASTSSTKWCTSR